MKTSHVTSVVLLVAGIVIGGGGMFLVYTMFLSSDTTRLETASSSGAQYMEMIDEISVPASNLSDDYLTLDSLHDPALLKNSAEQRLAVYSFVSKLSTQELTDMLEKASTEDNTFSPKLNRQLQTALVEKLAVDNPSDAVKFAARLDTHRSRQTRELANYSKSRVDQFSHMPLVQNVFSDWALKDRKVAITAAKSLDSDAKRNAIAGILSVQTGESLSTYRQIASELGDVRQGTNLYLASFASKFIEDPSRAWQEALGLGRDYVTEYGYESHYERALMSIAQQWYLREGFSVFDEIFASDFDNPLVMRSLFSDAARDDPVQALRYALNAPSVGGYPTHAYSVVTIWATTDPQAAWNAVKNIDKSQSREQLQSAVVRTWAQSDPDYILKNLGDFPSNLQEQFRREAIYSLAQIRPKDAAELVARNHGNEDYSFMEHSVIQEWFNHDMETAINWVYNGPVSEDHRRNWVQAITSQLVRTDPRRAFSLALQEKIKERQSFSGREAIMPGLEADVIRYLVDQDLDLALELFPKVRTGVTKTRAATAIGSQLIDNGEFNKAINLGLQLPTSEQTEYFPDIAYTWAKIDPSGFVKWLPSLPTDEMRSAVAGRVSSRYIRGHFTNEQFNEIKQYLPEADLKRLDD